jgi:glyoxylase-like metal-dependent hydrolase (beta-lactamase superfamily II)
MNRTLAVPLLLLTACATTSWKRADGLEIRTFTADSSNVHLVTKGDASFLVDSGYEKNAGALVEKLKASGVDLSKLKAIILTHAHADHAGGARVLRDTLRVPILAGAGDVEMLSKGKNEPPFCPTGFLGRMRVEEDGSATYTPYAASIVLTESTELAKLTGIPGKVVLVPGHTKGSLSVQVGDVVFVGDLLRGSVVGSGAETHLYMCDLEANKRDIANLLTVEAPAATLVFPGHFGPVTRESVMDHFDVKAPAR